jgi:mannose/cellobiose epimerase-like protein (N-acyl-D-glucosamine 2-epimerase family)
MHASTLPGSELRLDDCDAVSRRLHTWLAQSALPLWRQAGLDPRGGFAERLTLDGAPDLAAPRRVLVQMRQVYVFSHAAMLGLHPEGTAQARAALDLVMARARLSGGSFAYAIGPDGTISDATCDTYTLAFMLMATSWLYRASGDPAVLDHMDTILAAIEKARHPGGLGYAESDRPGPVRRQNPHMHLFEAFLAAHAATGQARYLEKAGEIFHLFRNHFFDPKPGVLREFFTQDLKPADGAAGEIVEPGHHHEWVWLLGEYAKAAGQPLPPEARALYDFAVRHGHEPATGLIYREVGPDGRVLDGGKRAWALTEAIKADIALAEADGVPLKGLAVQSIDGLFAHFLDRPRPGAWLDTILPDNSPAVATSAASNFYHVFLAFAEWMRFAGTAAMVAL